MIAISYRREDSLAVAGRLYDRLEQRFGKQNVFMDFDSIRPGFDFRDQIKETIERSKVVIAVIGPHWLGEQGDGSRRIDDSDDFVRLEVACALQRGIPVIPVLVNNTAMPKAEALPSDIQALAFRHALPLDSGVDFRQHADRLIMAVQRASASVRAGKVRSGRFGQNIFRASAGALVVVGIVAAFVIQVTKNKPEDTRHEKLMPRTATPPMLVESHPQNSGAAAMPAFAQPAAARIPQRLQSTRPHDEQTSSEVVTNSSPAPSSTPYTGQNLGGDVRLSSQTTERPQDQPPESLPATSPTHSKNAPTAEHGKQKLTPVYIKDFRCSVLVPTEVFPLRFADADRRMFLTGRGDGASIHFNVWQGDLAKAFKELCSSEHSKEWPQGTVQYKVLKDDWFVVSGTFMPDAGFYIKAVKRGNAVITMELRYPEDSCPLSADTITAMSRSFTGN